MHARIGSAVVLLVAVMATGAPVAAQSIPETLTVPPVISVSISATALDYGALGAGTTSGDVFVGGSVTSNAPVTLTFAGSPFAGPWMTLDQDVRAAWVLETSNQKGFATTVGLGYHTTSWLEAHGALYASTGAVSGAPWELALHVTPPAGAAAGTYGGQITLTFATP